MGLDNGIIARKSDNEKINTKLLALNTYTYSDGSHEIAYWRKCWNVRYAIACVLGGIDDNGETPLMYEDIIAVMDNKTSNIFWALILGGYQKYGNQEYLAEVIGDTHGDLLLVRKGSPLLDGLKKSKSSKAQIGQTLNSVNAENCVKMPQINSIIKNIKPVDIENDIVHAYATKAE